MGYLLIDTRQSGQAQLFWGGGERMEVWQPEGSASAILGIVQKRRELLAHELEGVIVASGPGRFSALRVGVLYAHLLARWFRVPLYEARPDDLQDGAAREACLAAIRSGQRRPQATIAPLYDREPNITSPRL